MAEWRIGRGWTNEELRARLDEAKQLPLSFDPEADRTPDTGWDIIHSWAVVACEPPGPPVDGGPFERLWHALQRFHHSDPRIVIAHFREDTPLAGRRVLLELQVQALGLHYLCPVAIGPTRDERDGNRTLKAFTLDTLEGHIESGREWFILEKDHTSGDVRFRIEAIWQPGEFPNAWSRLGFHLVGRRYQRAWHRLVHNRLRRIAAGLDPRLAPAENGLVHEGFPMPAEPVQFYAQRGLGRLEVDLEREEEDMRRDRLWRALGLGALSGVRSMSGPAVLASTLERHGKDVISGRKLGFPLGRVLTLLAAGEFVADKLPFTPARTMPPSLVARTFSGAFVGLATARKREARLAPTLVGAAAAAASTFASYHLRRLATQRSKRLGYGMAVAEDALALLASRKLARKTLGATAWLAHRSYV